MLGQGAEDLESLFRLHPGVVVRGIELEKNVVQNYFSIHNFFHGHFFIFIFDRAILYAILWQGRRRKAILQLLFFFSRIAIHGAASAGRRNA